MALKDMGTRKEYYTIDPRKLQIKSDWNSRDFSDPSNIAHVKDLAESIAENGVREPLKVYLENDIPYVTNGECRLRAVMLLIERGVDIKAVPVMAEDRLAMKLTGCSLSLYLTLASLLAPLKTPSCLSV